MELANKLDVSSGQEAKKEEPKQHRHFGSKWVRNKDARRIDIQRLSLIECVNFSSYIPMIGLKTHIHTYTVR